MNLKTIGIFMIFGALAFYSQWTFSSGLCKRAFQKIRKNKPTISRVEVKDPVIAEQITVVSQILKDCIIASKYYNPHSPFNDHSIESRQIRIFDSDIGPMIYTRLGEKLYSAILKLKNLGINASQFQQLFSKDLTLSRKYVEEKKLFSTHDPSISDR